MGVFGPHEMLIQLFHPDFGLLVGFLLTTVDFLLNTVGGRLLLVRGCCWRLLWTLGWKKLLLVDCSRGFD